MTTASKGGSLDYADATTYDLASNVSSVSETYTGGLQNRTITNSYDGVYRLLAEASTVSNVTTTTSYTYDSANNRSIKTVQVGVNPATVVTYNYNSDNQITNTTGALVASFSYDRNGNRINETQGSVSDTYTYDAENRLITLNKKTGPNGTGIYNYAYDYRTRRILRDETQAGGVSTALVFSGGTSVQEYDNSAKTPTVEYIRGSDYGGGVGGILYTLRSAGPSNTHANKRGDIVTKSNSTGSLTYQAQYQAFGTRPAENGSTLDRQKASSKDEDPTGLLDEGMRYRDLLTDTFITRDPAGMIDGPNEYTYVRQNPWTSFDPEGLDATADVNNVESFFKPIGDAVQAGQDWFRSTFESVSGGKGLPRVTGEFLQSQAKDLQQAAADLQGGRPLNAAVTIATDATAVETDGGSNVVKNVAEEGVERSGLGRVGDWFASFFRSNEEAGEAEFNSLKLEENAATTPGTKSQLQCKNGTCFAPGTLVLMGDGSSKPIEDIRVGDLVRCEEPNTSHKVEIKPVTELHHNWTKQFIHIRVTELSLDQTTPYSSKHPKTDQVSEILATGEHPFWTVNRGWVFAHSLQPGDKLLEPDGKEPVVVSAVESPTLCSTYNLTIEGTHTFFVLDGTFQCWSTMRIIMTLVRVLRFISRIFTQFGFKLNFHNQNGE